MVELLQTQRETGPCYEAYEDGRRVVASIDGNAVGEAWPTFDKLAREAGFETVIALPLSLRDRVIGALNLFRTAGGSLTQQDMAAAKALADLATIAILQERAARDSGLLIEQLQRALDSRVIIEQAKGVIAQQLDLTMEEAFSRLRRHARNNNRPLRQTAGDIVSGELSATRLPAD